MSNERGHDEKDRSKAKTVVIQAVSAPPRGRAALVPVAPRPPVGPRLAKDEGARLAAAVLRSSSFQGSGGQHSQHPKSTAPVATRRPARAMPPLPTVDLAFQLARRARLTGSVPVAEVLEKPLAPRELEVIVRTWTGETPRPEVAVTGSHLSPVATTRSRRGERSALALQAVLQQFAPAFNPRYDKGERGQLYVWDVATAMECVVPRFTRSGEVPLPVVASWFRTQSVEQQWHRVTTERALELASRGGLVIALPKLRGLDAMAILQPGRELRVASACRRRRGMHLRLRDALGVGAADFFFHE